ncbi:MAG TPA: nuclear transport factor 2 family protein [Terriglobia bacterium]|nr:nuclear transport factor 2 family protein [Terriglobia bacterium]
MTTNKRTSEVGIDRLRDIHVAALNAGDADAWVACFTDDGVQMPPHFAANVGKSAVRGWSQGFLNLFACRFSLSVDEVEVAADWALERGRVHYYPGSQGRW